MKLEGLRRGLAGGTGSVVGLLFANHLHWSIFWAMIISGIVAFIGYDIKGFINTVNHAWNVAIKSSSDKSKLAAKNFISTLNYYTILSTITIPFISIMDSTIIHPIKVLYALLIVTVLISFFIGLLSTFHDKPEVLFDIFPNIFRFYARALITPIILIYAVFLGVALLKLRHITTSIKNTAINLWKGCQFLWKTMKTFSLTFLREMAKLFLSVGRLASTIFAFIGVGIGALCGMSLIAGFMGGLIAGLVLHEVAYWALFPKIEI